MQEQISDHRLGGLISIATSYTGYTYISSVESSCNGFGNSKTIFEGMDHSESFL